jgi:NitT/TauT family transport system substrate-binding protein
MLVYLCIIILLINPMVLANAQTEHPKPIKIALTIWVPNFLTYVAQEKGIFDRNNVDVNITLFPNYGDAVKAYSNGEYDGILIVYSDAIILNSEGVDSTVVYNLDSSFNADAIVGNGNNLSYVVGKKIGVEGINSFSHFFVLKSLEKIGLNEGNVEFVDVSAPDVSMALKRDEIFAGHTYEPFVSKALANGFNILSTGAEVPGVITNVLAFHSDTIEERPQDIQNIIKSINEAKNDYDKDKEKSIEIMSSKSGLTPTEIKSGLSSVKLLDLDYNKNVSMNINSKNTTSLYVSGKDITFFYAERGVISDYPDIEKIINPQYVNNLASIPSFPGN